MKTEEDRVVVVGFRPAAGGRRRWEFTRARKFGLDWASVCHCGCDGCPLGRERCRTTFSSLEEAALRLAAFGVDAWSAPLRRGEALVFGKLRRIA